jgi:hypothetical protein
MSSQIRRNWLPLGRLVRLLLRHNLFNDQTDARFAWIDTIELPVSHASNRSFFVSFAKTRLNRLFCFANWIEIDAQYNRSVMAFLYEVAVSLFLVTFDKT